LEPRATLRFQAREAAPLAQLRLGEALIAAVIAAVIQV
jgi:hypothetical protein